MFLHVENTFFSQSWWDSLSLANQQKVTALAGIIFPHQERYAYSNERLVGWKITAIEQG
jgi:hypothetical protein